MDAGVLQSHTATQQWQSFEIRMRRKRIDRCVLRAAVAIDAGMLEDAREALEEVERLDSHEPAIEPLRAKLAAAESRAAARAEPRVVEAAPLESLVLNPAIPVASLREKDVLDTPTAPSEFLVLPETQRRVFPASAAALLIAVSGTTGWFVFSHNTPGEPAAARADTAVVYDSNTSAPRLTPPAEGGLAEPAVRISETAVNAAPMSEPVAPETPAPVAVASTGESAPNSPLDTAFVEAPRASTVIPAAEPPSPNTTSAPATTTSAANSIAPSASTAAPPAIDRRAVPASLEPSPPLPDLAPPPSVSPASNVAPNVSSGDATASAVAPVTTAPPAETSTAPAATVPATPSPAASQQPEENRVRSVLRRYEAAYSALDAAAASAVWPGVDRRALTSAFQALSSQSVSLGRCDVYLAGEGAQADCKGTARWQPKVGGGPQTAARQWRFDLRNDGGDWIITRATVR
jgi:hypothetical protein